MPEINWRKLWAEAVEQSKRDYAWQNADKITPGYWLAKMGRGCPDIPCAIWRCNHEPGNPENELKVPIFVAAAAGKEVDPLDVLVLRERREITEAAYATRTNEFAWVATWGDEDDPLKRPDRRPDLMKLKPVGPNG